MTLTTPHLGTICHGQLGHDMINLPTKFEVLNFTHYGNTKGTANVENGVVWGGLWSPKVIENSTIR